MSDAAARDLAGAQLAVGNEFTGAVVTKVVTGQGENLEIFIPRTGRRVRLDAMQLELIAELSDARFTELFAGSLTAPRDHPAG